MSQNGNFVRIESSWVDYTLFAQILLYFKKLCIVSNIDTKLYYFNNNPTLLIQQFKKLYS